MWGLFALEPIPAGAYVVDYVGEVLTAKDGDKRGKIYDSIGMSYLFDMRGRKLYLSSDKFLRNKKHFRRVSSILFLIFHREELTIDYGWDRDKFDIP